MKRALPLAGSVASLVLAFPPGRESALREALRARGYAFEERPHAFFLARTATAVVTAYRSGKLLVTGADAHVAAAILSAAGATDAAPPRAAQAPFAPRIGSDESGKGDYFGPLVVAAVAVETPEAEAALLRAGVRDSKTVADSVVGRMADAVESACPFEVEQLDPPEYNAAHARVGNLNTLLAAAHAEAIRRLLARTRPARIVVDRFAAASPVTALLRDSALPVEERVGAEADVAVAAASIVARRRFLGALTVLSEEAGLTLPKGAGESAQAAARVVRQLHGEAGLARVGKVHFALRG